MTCTLAVAGKGGTGKTTLAALITRGLRERGRRPVLAVDADPNANLDCALGLRFDRTVVEVVDAIMAGGPAQPAGVPKGRLVEYQVHDAVVEADGLDLLVMGHSEGPGCYCYANDLLRGFLDRLSSSYACVVLDNEAGMEHLSRRTTRNVDALLVVANPTAPALLAARRIHQIAGQLKLVVGRSGLVLNRLNPAAPGANGSRYESELEALAAAGLPLLGEIPFDEEVYRRSLEGAGLLDLEADSPAARAAAQLLDLLEG